jgi:hypothetical protein
VLNMSSHPTPDRWPPPGRRRSVIRPSDLATTPIPTSSLVFRRASIERSQADTDLTTFLEVIQHGPIDYLDCCMAAYRVHDSGFCAGNTKPGKRWRTHYLAHFAFQCAAGWYERRGDFQQACRMLRGAMLYLPCAEQRNWNVLPWWCRLRFPRAYNLANRIRKQVTGKRAGT